MADTHHSTILERLARLTPDQRAAATAPPGPILCVAPAGSGKTTTLVARMAWLVDGGAHPSTMTAITFNARAAQELRDRLDAALAGIGLPAGSVRVRTFHALGREILRDAGIEVSNLVDRATVMATCFPDVDDDERARLDTVFSRLKLEHGVSADDVAADPEAGPTAEAFLAYERELDRRGAMDFDDLVRRALATLETDRAVLARWRARCGHLLVDEVQDVDRSQLRLALLLAAPSNRIFLVGDDDQSIYGWRLADVRRVLALDASLPGLRRVDLEVNHRCPAPVIERAVRLVDHNRERFAKVIRPRPDATGTLVLAPDAADEPERTARLLRSWPDDGGSRAVLARTNRELQAAVVAAIAADLPFHAPSVTLPVEDAGLDELLTRTAAETPAAWPLLARIGAMSARPGGAASAADRATLAAVLGWAPAFPDLPAMIAGVRDLRDRLAGLRRPDARLSLATAHATKGAEWDHVAVLGMDAGRFPSGRAVGAAEDPVRAMEEERRLAYVAWTRARRTLTLSYDPGAPSPFLLEAFDPAELGTGAAIAGRATMTG